MTLRELIELYMRRYGRKRLQTADAIEWSLQHYAKDLLDRSLATISDDDAENLHSKISEDAPTQANRVIQALRAIWNRGIRWRKCSSPNPFAIVELNPETVRTTFLTPSQARKLIYLLDQDHNTNLRDFALLCLYTGVRRSNILSMRWENLSLEDGLWIIPRTKNGAPQTVLLGPIEIEILESRKNDSPWVFPSRTKKGSHWKWPYKSWRRLVRQAGIEDLWIHDLRRSLACAMADLGVNASTIQAALGHKSLATTLKIYAIAGKQAELEARRLVQRHWLEKKGAHY